MIVRTVQPMGAQIPGASVTPHTVNVILHFFPVLIKMRIITHVLSKKHRVTVTFTGHASVELGSCHLFCHLKFEGGSQIYRKFVGPSCNHLDVYQSRQTPVLP